ncbi:MAG: inorganic pyrophosphatase [Planctomycetota bacterium]
MSEKKPDPIWNLMGLLFKSHPWHGVQIGDEAPDIVSAFVEIVPTDTVKYELDKHNGYLKVDRPQKFSNVCPTIYGLIPQTYCGTEVARLCEERTGRTGIAGDSDPLDICILTEKTISHGNIFLKAKPIGGLRMIDGNQADDKIIAIMQGDAAYGDWQDIDQCPTSLVDRLRHYFLTYKTKPGAITSECEITHIYGRKEAHEVIKKSQLDYSERFGSIPVMLTEALWG